MYFLSLRKWPNMTYGRMDLHQRYIMNKINIYLSLEIVYFEGLQYSVTSPLFVKLFQMVVRSKAYVEAWHYLVQVIFSDEAESTQSEISMQRIRIGIGPFRKSPDDGILSI